MGDTMRHTTLLLAILLIATAIGCGSSADDTAQDCAAALTERTGGDRKDTPTVPEANKRVAAFDKTLAGMVRSGYQSVAGDAFEAMANKTKEGGEFDKVKMLDGLGS
ncbi:hypothetical protein [Streptomyces sp. NPDC001422]|uniref:hypothetical protein n=1 Tax=Streptomyces sp. NPDC001422 TaxID=3364575 RepID=UPI0036B17C09